MTIRVLCIFINMVLSLIAGSDSRMGGRNKKALDNTANKRREYLEPPITPLNVNLTS